MVILVLLIPINQISINCNPMKTFSRTVLDFEKIFALSMHHRKIKRDSVFFFHVVEFKVIEAYKMLYNK